MQAARKSESKESPLSVQEAEKELKNIPNWRLLGDRIEREFNFSDFAEAMRFVNNVADRAQEHNHHPEIQINYNRVKLDLSTHKVGGLSGLDFTLAEHIDRLMK